MHASDPGQFGFKMRNGSHIWIVLVEVSKGTMQQSKKLGFVMITLRAEFNQFYEIGCCLNAQIALTDARERSSEGDFSQGVQS